MTTLRCSKRFGNVTPLAKENLLTRASMLHHVQVVMPAHREMEARQFDGEVMGLEELEKPDSLKVRGGVWFVAGTLQVHLGVEAEFAPARKAHLAYQVPDLTAMRERLVLEGYTVIADADLPGYARFYTADPFGNRVEVLSPFTEPDQVTG